MKASAEKRVENDLIQRLTRYVIICLAFGFGWVMLAKEASTQTADREALIEDARRYLPTLRLQVSGFQRQVERHQQLVDPMLTDYDRIMTEPPSRFRTMQISNYRSNYPTAYASKLNLDNAIRQIESHIERAKEFRDDLRRSGERALSGVFEFWAEEAVDAVIQARMIPRPPPLPDPLPDPVAPVKIINTDYEQDVVVDEENAFVVTLRSNRQFISTYVTVEARVRAGEATLRGPARRVIEVKPQQTATITWRFVATAEGDIRIGARIVTE